MTPDAGESQLELFDVQHQSARRPSRRMLGWFVFQMRHDQLVLAGMLGVLGLTVIFAFGVERGKQLVRFERAMLVRERPAAASPTASPAATTEAARPSGEPASAATVKDTPAPMKAPKAKGPPSKLASEKASTPSVKSAGRSRYAVQVVTFTRPFLAKQELDKLQANGERGFLVIKEGRTIVYVGPFPSRDNATEKLGTLKSRYHDCFLRTL